MNVNPYRDFALKLAACLRFHITPPIPVGEKFPRCRWKYYQTVPANLFRIEEWADREPTANYGIITGRIPNTVFIDADSSRAVSIVKDRCAMTPLVQRSGSGRGIQFGYRYPKTTPDLFIKTQAKIKLDGNQEDIDIRGMGGLVVGPGCTHRTGGKYQMVGDWFSLSPADIPVFNPHWLDLDTQPPKARTVTPVRQLGEVTALQQMAREHLLPVPGATEGRGAEKYTLAVAFSLIHGFGLTVEEALPVFIEWGQKRSQRGKFGEWFPWSEGDLERKLDYAADNEDREGREIGYLLPVDETRIINTLKGNI